MRLFIIATLLLCVAGCVSPVAKVDSGDKVLSERMTVTLDGAWNHAPGTGPAQIWTMEGLPVDQLLLYSGVKNGDAIHPESHATGSAAPKVFTFRSDMQADEIVTLFEGTFTRDGSRFKLLKLEPVAFGGTKGFRFEFSLIRKIDNVQLSGLGYGTVSKGELFAIVYMAPQLAFFPRHVASVEQLCRSARIKE